MNPLASTGNRSDVGAYRHCAFGGLAMQNPIRFPAVPFLSICMILFACGARGQGILYPRPEIREQPFSVKSVRVTSTINDGVAETLVEQTFVNNSSVEQEGTYLFPLPDGATVTSFTLQAG